MPKLTKAQIKRQLEQDIADIERNIKFNTERASGCSRVAPAQSLENANAFVRISFQESGIDLLILV